MDGELKFLVVEDDPIDAKTVRRILGGAGISQRTDTAQTLEEAKDKIRQGCYDAVILDLGLPDSQGLDGVIDVQATAPELPIVVLTGMQDEDAALRSVDIGAEDFLRKDLVTQDSLFKALRFAIERHRRKREIFRDMDSLRLSLDDAMREATTDPLTGLSNRRGLNRYLEHLSKAAPSQPVIVGVADLDHFKTINDIHGHGTGDAVLREFSVRLQHCLRATDFAARIGGDEFVVIFGGANRRQSVALAGRILSHISWSPVHDAGKFVYFSATMGLAEMAPPFIDLEQILLQPHSLLAQGKGGGRNRVECAWRSPADEAPAEEGAQAAARGAVEDELHMHVREVRSISGDALLGHHLTFGLGPESWPLSAPAISRARMENRLSQMTLQCLLRAQQWRLRHDPAGMLHLDLEADAFSPWLCTELTRVFRTDFDRNSCVLFLHSDFPEHPRQGSLSELRLLRQAGFRLGVRGLGDGSSILEHVMLLEPAWLRFDPALTSNIARFRQKTESLRRLGSMLAPLGARLAAEEGGGGDDLKKLAELGFEARYCEPAQPSRLQV